MGDPAPNDHPTVVMAPNATGKPRTQWDDLVVIVMVLAGIATVGVRVGVASAPQHGWPWIAAGILAGVAWVVAAFALHQVCRLINQG